VTTTTEAESVTTGSPTATTPFRSDFIVVANRLPVTRTTTRPRPAQTFGRGDGWETSPGGLVGALAPVLAERTGAWVGWPGQSGPAPEPFQHEGMRLFPVGLTADEFGDFYEGFANGTLWPLYHDAIRAPEFHRTWWDAYVVVNERYARAAARVAAPGATVWIHDYQLQLVPGMLRAERPDLRIGFFLHIPYPPQELFMQLPWRSEIVDGLLGADVVGFQVPVAAQNFARLARRLVGATGNSRVLRYHGRTIRVGDFPISIDVARVEKLASSPLTQARSADVRRNLGNPTTVLLGVDRLDYTKGIDLRLRAFQEMLRDGTLKSPDTVMVQIAVPSREEVASYAEQRERVERLVGEINGDFGQMGRPAVHYLHRGLPFHELVALYRAADVMLVTPLRDGMNLVAKEYVASRVDGRGALVLSEFAGSAQELRSAYLVNPHDIDDLKEAIQRAVHHREVDQRRRMRSLRAVVGQHDVHSWAESFLSALSAPEAPAPG
jgi:trehalose 6-phosphate synthase